MTRSIKALRGATTVDQDSVEDVTKRVQGLITELMGRNQVQPEDIVFLFFTATDDIHSMFPSTAVRAMGLNDVVLFSAQEMNVEGALPRCIRAMMIIETDLDKSQLRHAFLEGAVDLPSNTMKAAGLA